MSDNKILPSVENNEKTGETKEQREEEKETEAEAVDPVHPSVGQARPDRNSRRPQGGP